MIHNIWEELTSIGFRASYIVCFLVCILFRVGYNLGIAKFLQNALGLNFKPGFHSQVFVILYPLWTKINASYFNVVCVNELKNICKMLLCFVVYLV